jgi:putative RNA 2'-phosphotransferase
LGYLKVIVDNDTRYTFNNDFSKIRAYHGHSIKGIIYQNKQTPPSILYHGTSFKNYELILESGMIKGMSRVQVHLSKSINDAKKIGNRHGKPIVLAIDCDTMVNDGFKFYESGDGVWLTDDIPIKYIKNIEK